MKIEPLTLNEATGETAQTLQAINSKLGMLPNLYAVMAKAPAVLNHSLQGGENLRKGVLSAKVGEQIAVAVAVANSCDYCLAAHTTIGRGAGLSDEELAAAQSGKAQDPKTQAILDLALAANRDHGKHNDHSVAQASAAGLSEQEVLETIAHVVQNILTNTVNNLADVAIDFPEVKRVAPTAA